MQDNALKFITVVKTISKKFKQVLFALNPIYFEIIFIVERK